MTLDEAIKVLRQHNVTNMPVLRITRGQALERDLLAQVLDSCEQLISEKAEYKRLLKLAVEDIHELLVERKDISIRNTGRGCMVCNYAANCNCCEICTVINELKNWRHADEALELIGDESDGI